LFVVLLLLYFQWKIKIAVTNFEFLYLNSIC
jgi:hypothetical protein